MHLEKKLQGEENVLLSFRVILCVVLFSVKVVSHEFVLQNPSIGATPYTTAFFINEDQGWVGGGPLLYYTSDGGKTWVQQELPDPGAIQAIHFTDLKKGWVVGGVPQIPYAAKTIDGGNTWTEVKIPSASTWFSKVFFSDSLNGWILHANNAANLLATNDGGLTWSASQIAEGDIMREIVFADKNRWYAGGDRFFAGTANAGKGWILSDCQEDGGYIRKIQMFSTGIGYYIGCYGIYRTADTGKTWTASLPFSKGICYAAGMHFAGEQNGFAMVGPPIKVANTADAGLSWAKPIETGLEKEVIDIVPLGQNKTIIICSAGALCMATADGDSVFEVTRGSGNEVMCIDFCSETFGVAGNSRSRAALMWTKNGGKNWEEEVVVGEGDTLKTVEKVLCFGEEKTILAGCNRDAIYSVLAGAPSSGVWKKTGINEPVRKCGRIPGKTESAFLFVNSDRLYITDDCGNTWKERIVPFAIGARYTSLSFLNSDTAFAVSPEGVKKTGDGCNTWVKVCDSTPIVKNKRGIINDAYFCSADTGWIGGYVRDADVTHPVICKTTDGGNTWAVQEDISYLHINWAVPSMVAKKSIIKIRAKNGSEAWAVDDRSAILHTVDGGKSWKEVYIKNRGIRYSNIYYGGSDDQLWICGLNNGIWKYTDTSTEIINKNIEKAVPVRGQFAIDYPKNRVVRVYLNEKTSALLQIFDIQGRIVLKKTVVANESTIEIPHSISNGFYLAVLNVRGENIEAKRILVRK